jgi:hypothetical protein
MVIACEDPSRLMNALNEMGERTMIVGKTNAEYAGLKF